MATNKSSKRSSANSVTPQWQTAKFWQKLFIYFWVFSIIGHYLEKCIVAAYHLICNIPSQPDIPITFLPLSPPYGIGVAAIILFVIPLVKRYKPSPLTIYTFNVVIASLVEYLCAIIIILFIGHNYFWSYASIPFNLQGQISLYSSLIFGIAANIFVYSAYPFCENQFRRLNSLQTNIIFFALLIAYSIDLAVYFW